MIKLLIAHKVIHQTWKPLYNNFEEMETLDESKATYRKLSQDRVVKRSPEVDLNEAISRNAGAHTACTKCTQPL